MKTIIKDYGKKFLSLVLAIVMTLSLVNLAPFAEDAKAATDITVHVCVNKGAVVNSVNMWNSNSGVVESINKEDSGSDTYDWYAVKITNFSSPSSSYANGASMAINMSGDVSYSSGDGLIQEGATDYYVDATAATATALSADEAKNYGYSGGGSTEEPTTEETTAEAATEATVFLFTFKDATNGTWLSEAGAIFRVIADGQTYNMSGGDGTWTAELSSDVSTLKVNRLNPDYPDTDPWASWDIDATVRGSSTTYYATNVDGSVGSGQWTQPSTEQTSTEAPTQPSTEAPTQPSTEAPSTGDSVTGYYNFDILELAPVVDTNSDINSRNDLIVMPAIMYNYKSIYDRGEEGNTTIDPNTAGNWWRQYKSFDDAIVSKYYTNGNIDYPLLIGAHDIKNHGASDDNGKRGLTWLSGIANDNTIDYTLFHYINHNLVYSGNSDREGGLSYYGTTNPTDDSYNSNYGAALQGLAGSQLNSDLNIVFGEDNSVVMPFFDDSFLGTTNTNNGEWAKKYGTQSSPISFPFRDRGDGYYVFDSKSGEDNVYMKDGKLVYDSSASAQIHNPSENSSDVGFFPFNTTYTATSDAKTVASAPGKEDKSIDYGFGMRVDIPFNVRKSVDLSGLKYANADSVKSYTNGNNSRIEVSYPVSVSGETYILITSLDGGNANLDYIKVGDQAYAFMDGSDVDKTEAKGGTTLFAGDSNQPLGAVNGKPIQLRSVGAYAVLKVNGTADAVTLGCRAYENTNIAVVAIDSLNNVNAAIEEVKEVNSAGPTVFNFSGDDDLWVYVDGELALDIGGSHGRAEGSINFTEGTVYVKDRFEVDFTSNTITSFSDADDTISVPELKITDPKETHVLTIFYMERGLYDSNLMIEFNFEPHQMLTAGEKYYAEIGTPITMDIPEEFKSIINEEVVKNAVNSINGGTAKGSIEYKDGKIVYTNNSLNTEAYQEVFVITTSNGDTLTYTINNYKMNDDVYVIDYGLPVELHTNDEYDLFYNDKLVFGSAVVCEYGLATNDIASGLYTVTGLSGTESIAGSNGYGTAAASGLYNNKYSSYKYTLNKFLDGVDTFYYSAQVIDDKTTSLDTLSANNATPVMTSKVTIVPANVVYYEDNFTYNSSTGTTSAITYTGSNIVVNNTGLPIQSNNQADLYGYDSKYAAQIEDSFGSTELKNGNVVEFTFKGTGIDIITRTAGNTPAVIYAVYNENNETEAFGIVDTLYKNGTLYQLPVISVKDLDYGTHKVKFTIMDTTSSTASGNSVFYFDGIRIYNPAGGEATVEGNYLNTEKNVTFESVRDMVLGNATLSETTFVDENGNVITDSYIPGSKATITGGQVTENINGSTTQNLESAVTALRSAPNNEVYLAAGSNLEFSVAKDTAVADANRTLQIEVKAVKTSSATGDANLAFTINGTAVTIQTSTAMYYNIPVGADGKVVITGASNGAYNLSLTNIKYSGYTLVENTKTVVATGTYISGITVNGGSVVDSEMVATAKTRIKLDLTFSNSVDVSSSNLRLNVNGNDAVYYFRLNDATAKQGGGTVVSGTEIPLEVIAPNVAGIYTYKFEYTDAAGNTVSKTFNVNIIPRSTRK